MEDDYMANQEVTAVRTKRRSLGVIAVSLWLAILLGVVVVAGMWPAQQASAGDGLVGGLAATAGMTKYLPMVAFNHPEPLSGFGVEIYRREVGATISRAAEGNVGWVRYNGVVWHEVEAVQGVRDWTRLRKVDEELAVLSAQGLTPMVVIRGTPTWAQREPGLYCGPIKEDAFDEFADFVGEVVDRYKGPPYNVKYWEILNEPDAYMYILPGSPYGCWGDPNPNLQYYGGRYYGKMLKQVYPAIKQADPAAQVLLGGLLMGCDSEDPNPQPEVGTCPSGKFFEGILVEGAGYSFDLLAYHAYPFWYGQTKKDYDLYQQHWDHRGGALLGKLDFLWKKMQQYGINKPIIMNEGGLVCGWSEEDPDYVKCQGNDLQLSQASYLVKLYTRTLSHGIIGSAWYTLNGPGWREGGLLDEFQNPRPAFNSFKFLAKALDGASYSRPLTVGALEGYVFSNKQIQKDYYFYWTNDAATVPITPPAGTAKVYDMYGRDITPPPGTPTVNAGFEPIVFEVNLR
jgi:hypothetical protein